MSLFRIYFLYELDKCTYQAVGTDKNGATTSHRLANKPDHLLSLGLHQCYPGGRSTRLWIVLGTPIRHLHQNRDEIETFLRQNISLFSHISRMGPFLQDMLLLQMS